MLDSMANLQRLSSRAGRHGGSMYTEKENDKGAGRRDRVPQTMWDLVCSGASGDEPTLKLGERGG